MKRSYLFLTFGLGLLLSVAGFRMLNSTGQGIRPDRNPFAIQQSGYGKTLARLSQDTVDVVWHLGIEQVNPVDHSNCDHDHGHCDHGHEDHHEEAPNEEDRAAANLALLSLNDEDKGLLAESGIDQSEIHCAECLETVMVSLRKGEAVLGEDLPAIHAFHQMSESEDAHDHAGHDHSLVQNGDEHAGHDHGDEADADPGVQGDSLVTGAKEWIWDLRAAQYNRNSPFAISEVHKKAIAKDIEKILLRGYNMDPTDYGVYNGYFLFLTLNELCAESPGARNHARHISRLTISKTMSEDVDPQPWLTASMATLNLFFLDQEDMRGRGEEVPAKMLKEYQDQMRYCLHQYAVIREKAMAEGRWDLISEARRKDMKERQQFASVVTEQFGAMLARSQKGGKGEEGQETAAEMPTTEGLPPNPIVENRESGLEDGE